jgi:hypothetical protein
MRPHRQYLSWAGIVAGAAAWAVGTQTAYALVPLACVVRFAVTVPITIFCIVVAVIGACLSYQSTRRRADVEWENASGGRAYGFVAWVGTGVGILFAVTIANQAAASLILDGCLQ